MLGNVSRNAHDDKLLRELRRIDERSDKDKLLRNVEPIDITIHPRKEEIYKMMTEAKWGSRDDFGSYSNLLDQAWLEVQSYHRGYRVRWFEAIINFAILGLLSFAIVIINVLDTREMDSASEDELRVWKIVLPAVATAVYSWQSLRHSTYDAMQLFHAAGLVQTEMYKLRTQTGPYDPYSRKDDAPANELMRRKDRGEIKKVFQHQLTKIHRYAQKAQERGKFPCSSIICRGSKGQNPIEYAIEHNIIQSAGKQTQSIDRVGMELEHPRRCCASLRHIGSKTRFWWDLLMIAIAIGTFVVDTWILREGNQDGAADNGLFQGGRRGGDDGGGENLNTNEFPISADELFWITFGIFLFDFLLNIFSTGACPNNRHIGDPQRLYENFKAYGGCVKLDEPILCVSDRGYRPWIIIDIVALVPWSKITAFGTSMLEGKDHHTRSGARLLRIFRILKMLKLFRASKHIVRADFSRNSRKLKTRGGDDGKSELSGPEYVTCRMEHTLARYKEENRKNQVWFEIIRLCTAVLTVLSTVLASQDDLDSGIIPVPGPAPLLLQ